MSKNFRRIFDKLRRPDKNRKNPIALLFFGAIFAMIIFAFIFMDPGMMGGGSYGNSTAIRVGSSVIPISTYRQQMQMVEQSMGGMMNSGDDYVAKMIRRQMQQQAINSLVNKEIIESIQDQEGLLIPDGMVSKTIFDLEFFKEEGRFQRDRYYAFLSNMGMTAETFEKGLRKDLRFMLVQDLFTDAFKKNSIEDQATQGLDDLRFQLDYVTLSSEDFKVRANVSDEEATAFLSDSANAKKAKDYYSKNIELYTEPESVKAKLILILSEDGSAKGFADAKAKLDEISKTLTVENFSEMAKEHSDDPTASAGGELGYVERGTYIPEWDEVAFNTGVGVISKPFRTDAGWMRLLVEEKKDAKKKDFETAKLDVAKALVAEQKASQTIDQVRDLLKNAKFDELDQLLRENDLAWISTPTMGLDTKAIPGIGASERIISSVLSLKQDKEIFPSLIPFDEKLYLVRRGKITLEKSEKNPMQALNTPNRNNVALSQWLDEQRQNFKIDINPALQEELQQ